MVCVVDEWGCGRVGCGSGCVCGEGVCVCGLGEKGDLALVVVV